MDATADMNLQVVTGKFEIAVRNAADCSNPAQPTVPSIRGFLAVQSS